jgi:hypothetical protein
MTRAHALARTVPVILPIGGGTYDSHSCSNSSKRLQLRARRRRAWRSRIAADILARPSGVLGPVDSPPWFGHRPLRSAWRRQLVPRRVRAAHRGRSRLVLLRPLMVLGVVIVCPSLGPVFLPFAALVFMFSSLL